MQSSSSCLILEAGISNEKKPKLGSNQTNSELYFDVLESFVVGLVLNIIEDKHFPTTPGGLL